MRAQGNNFSFNGQSIYIGIDVHKKSWSVDIITQSGYREHFTQESKAEVLLSHLQKRYKGGNYYSVYESGFTGFSTHYSLVNLGINNIIVNAADVPISQKEMLHKSDKVDAKRLASSLKAGKLQGIYIFDKEELAFREMVRVRSTLVKENTRCKNRIQSCLFRQGIDLSNEFPTGQSHWSARFIDRLKEIAASSCPSLSYYIDSYLREREALVNHTKDLRNFCKEEKYAQKIDLLMSIPGIGFITSIVFLSEIGNIDRFKNERSFASFIGIVPTCHDSGEKKTNGEMTFRTNKYLSRCLIESSWVAIRTDFALAACYGELCKRMNSNDAIIRIARKLSNRILAVLKKKEKYEFGKNNQ
ncbi:transposase [Dysgonomonadaceae bacterium PH5-43]|nr:transposase [Dysgonomonadaceae bacterium PH5-43]